MSRTRSSNVLIGILGLLAAGVLLPASAGVLLPASAGMLLPASAGVLLPASAGMLFPASAASAQEGVEISALAIREEGSASRVVIHITIDRWTTAEERAALIKAFREGGQDALLAALQKQPKAGYVNMPQTVARDVYYAYKFPGQNGGTIIVIVTDRLISQAEVRGSNVSLEYPFGFVELQLNAQGRGEGSLSRATKVTVAEDGKTLKLGSYGSGPMTLKEVRVKTKGSK